MRRLLCLSVWLVLVSCDSDNKMSQSYDTIVIGLGAAGATAASTLAKAGKRVLALEAQNRVGGRVCTVPFADNVVEIGAEWIHGEKPSRVYDLAIANNITVRSQDLSMEIFRSDGSIGNQTFLNDLITFSLNQVEDPPAVPAPLGQHLTKKIREYIKEKKPELLNDEDFVDGFLNFMDLVIDNYEASNTWNDVSTETEYRDLEGDLHLSWHRHGYKTFFEILLNTYNNGPGYPNLDIKLNTEVVNIKYSQDPNDSVVVTTKDGAVYKANNVIVTLSVGVLKERHTIFDPPLPQQKIDAINRISMGLINKVILSFPEKWYNHKATTFFWIEKDRKALAGDEKWISNFIGATAPMGSDTALSVWCAGDTARLIETLPEDLLKNKVMQVVRMFMGAGRTIPEPTGMVRSTWYSNPYTRGSYTFDNLLMPQFPNTRVDLGQPLTDASGKPRVLFAGEATDRTHFSTVHGASDTGYREAMRLLPNSKI